MLGIVPRVQAAEVFVAMSLVDDWGKHEADLAWKGGKRVLLPPSGRLAGC